MGLVSDPTRGMEYLFDYGNISDENKAAALEIANYLDSQGLSEIATAIKIKFKIVEIPKYSLDASPIVEAFKRAGIYCSVQGYVQEGVAPNIIQYPLLSINADIRHFEALIPVIKSMDIVNETN